MTLADYIFSFNGFQIAFTINFIIVSGFFALLIRYYLRTQIFDALIFSGVFLTQMLNYLSWNFTWYWIDENCPAGECTGSTYDTFWLIIKLNDLNAGLMFVISTLLLLFHIIRLHYNPALRHYLIISTPFVLAMLCSILNIIFSMSPQIMYVVAIFINEGFDLIVFSIMIVAYIKVELLTKSKRVSRARNLYIIGGSVFIVANIGSYFLLPFAIYLTALGLFIIGLIPLFYPEALLITKVQFYRAMQLYEKVTASDVVNPIDNLILADYFNAIKAEGHISEVV